MSANIVNLCESFMDAVETGPDDFVTALEDGMTDDEGIDMVNAAFMPMAGGRDDGIIEIAEIFATAAYRLGREDDAAALIDLALTDGVSSLHLRRKAAPNMAKLVDLARA